MKEQPIALNPQKGVPLSVMFPEGNIILFWLLRQ